MRETFTRQEKLKRKKWIAQLFAEGKSISVFPLKLVYLQADHGSSFKIQAGVSVSKRSFKKAVERNRMKRLIREAYRKSKYLVYASENTKNHIFMFIYQGKNEVSYQFMEEKMVILLERFLLKQKNRKDEKN
jgi:ribonuclease P protein component